MGHGRKSSRLAPIKARQAAKHWSKPMAMTENPHGIPSDVMRTLAQEGLSSDPAAYNARLQALLRAIQRNGEET